MKNICLSLILSILTIFVGSQSFAQNEITLADIWAVYKFYPASIDDIKSLPNGNTYSVLKNNKIVEFDYKTAEEITILVDGRVLKDGDKKIQIEEYSFSPDMKFAVIGANIQPIYRHSVMGDYFVFNMETSELVKIPGDGNVRLPDISPDGKSVAFVRDNNLYIFDMISKKETAVTTDGKFNFIINGTCDWVYEEEFGFTKAFFWSPKGNYIAYYRMDESNVRDFTIDFYGELYPEPYKYKYPKAGEDNSIVDIYVYNVSEQKNIKMDIGSETDQYIPRIKWTETTNTLAIQRLNRLQNHLDILFANAIDGKSTVFYSEDNKYYIDITDNWHFLKNNRGWVMTSEKSGYNHIYLYDSNGNMQKQLTSGNWDIHSVLGVDENKNLVYYLSYEDGPQNIMLYSVSIDKGKKNKITKELGTHDIYFSNTYKFFIDQFSDANTAPSYTIKNANGSVVKVLEKNEALQKRMKEYDFVSKDFFNFTTSQGVNLNGWMMKPANMEKNKKYPVLMYVYGGPGVNTVNNTFGYMDFAWFQMLTQKGYVVVSVDNRGTGGRGEEFKKATYLQLGKYETEDQIEVTKYLSGLDFVDSKRIGIFGWSFGGYLSTLCMTKGADYFKAGIAVAPVTNWRYYDNVYTERFMRTPQENADGYDNNSPMNFAKKLKGKYFLVHGSADDNVHAQNAYDLITALVSANKDFEMFLYPNKNHSIYGGYTRYHLYNKMTNFILNNL